VRAWTSGRAERSSSELAEFGVERLAQLGVADDSTSLGISEALLDRS
jgi:hypothetical protein